MELIKIGKYIAGKRKELGLTQRQVAEELGMSDKSVSKWERGICLPDASVYSELCRILGISIHELFAGEDVSQEDMVRRSEENLIGVVTDSKHRQTRAAKMIGVLLVILLGTLTMMGVLFYRSNRPRNQVTPVDRDSVEVKTAELLSGPDGAFVYKFTTTDEYSSLKIHVSEYQLGVLVNKERFEVGDDGMGSPKNGNIYVIPDFSRFMVRLLVVSEGCKYSAELPILADVPGRAHYGRSATEIRQTTEIRYDEEQPLVALIYDHDEMWALDLQDLMGGETGALAMNDEVYCISFEFCKEKSNPIS